MLDIDGMTRLTNVRHIFEASPNFFFPTFEWFEKPLKAVFIRNNFPRVACLQSLDPPSSVSKQKIKFYNTEKLELLA